tara:strand:+ start:3200 stop:4441 length:1242 start_codon:yes stop_codon:yes gene_type:complete
MNNTNPTALTVTQLNNQVKGTLHQKYQNLDVIGEINNFKEYSSGHAYFTLKDKTSQLSCVMFNSYYKQVDMQIEDGLKVVLSGDASLYIPKGSYQFSVKKIKSSNQKGDIYKEYEKLKKELLLEGLFDSDYKKNIPLFPSKIGIVTSLDGSVIKDIINISKRRSSSVDLVLSPSSVQGSSAPDEIMAALKKLEEYNEKDNLDIIIIARGGGSFEDLHCFNNELLARKVFKCNIPIISAIGHETDFTILDFVSDVRASTPSEAAELSVPDDNETIQSLDLINNKILKSIIFKIDKYKENYNLLNAQLKEFNPYLLVKNYKIKVLAIQDKIVTMQKNIYNNVDDKIQHYNKLLYHNNPYNILNKGFAVVSNQKKQLIKKIDDVKLEDKISIRFQDGLALARIQSKKREDNGKEKK